MIIVTLALESDVSPVEERDGAAASALSKFLSVHPHAARGTTRVLRTWVFPCATSFHEHPDGVCSSRPLVVRAAGAPASYAVVACAQLWWWRRQVIFPTSPERWH